MNPLFKGRSTKYITLLHETFPQANNSAWDNTLWDVFPSPGTSGTVQSNQGYLYSNHPTKIIKAISKTPACKSQQVILSYDCLGDISNGSYMYIAFSATDSDYLVAPYPKNGYAFEAQSYSESTLFAPKIVKIVNGVKTDIYSFTNVSFSSGGRVLEIRYNVQDDNNAIIHIIIRQTNNIADRQIVVPKIAPGSLILSFQDLGDGSSPLSNQYLKIDDVKYSKIVY